MKCDVVLQASGQAVRVDDQVATSLRGYGHPPRKRTQRTCACLARHDLMPIERAVLVEQVEQRSRCAGQELGAEPKGTPGGTTVTVEQLFANVPARLKFLRSTATEVGQVGQLVSAYALAYPEVRFTLAVEGRTSFQTDGCGDRRAVLASVYGIEVARAMLAVGGEDHSADGEHQPGAWLGDGVSIKAPLTVYPIIEDALIVLPKVDRKPAHGPVSIELHLVDGEVADFSAF